MQSDTPLVREAAREDLDAVLLLYCILSVYVRNFGVWGRALWSHSGGTPEHGFPPGIAMTAPALGRGRRPEAGRGGGYGYPMRQ